MTGKVRVPLCILLPGATLPTLGASFSEVQIYPGNGVTTNVAEVIGGAVNVTVNPGASGGGIVAIRSGSEIYGKLFAR